MLLSCSVFLYISGNFMVRRLFSLKTLFISALNGPGLIIFIMWACNIHVNILAAVFFSRLSSRGWRLMLCLLMLLQPGYRWLWFWFLFPFFSSLPLLVSLLGICMPGFYDFMYNWCIWCCCCCFPALSPGMLGTPTLRAYLVGPVLWTVAGVVGVNFITSHAWIDLHIFLFYVVHRQTHVIC